MSLQLRRAICAKLAKVTNENHVFYELEVPSKSSQTKIQHRKPSLTLALGHNERPEELLQRIQSVRFGQDLVEQVRLVPPTHPGKTPPRIELQIAPQTFVDSVLLSPERNAYKAHFSDQHLVFEFSSPNIAKPFHVGHLRSTIIGNVLSNIHQHLGYKVTKLNYLGDWGTQLGLLHVGVELESITDEDVQRAPIETLYRAYVAANMAAKTDPEIAERARQYFTKLEIGTDPEMTRQWVKYREYTVRSLEQTYTRLGVHFDAYEWESQYSHTQVAEILSRLDQKSLLLEEQDGRKVVPVGERRVPIIKSDGSTLYLARDIAALIDRFRRLHFERIFYIVDNAQSDHFNAVFATSTALCDDLGQDRMRHVKFGRIRGMSTRSGNVIFLRDVLNEAQDIMAEKQRQSPTTKVDMSSGSSDALEVADVLGVSAVLVNDLKQRRQRDYDFDWSKALQVNGDTGIKLQYTHSRLHSLLEHVAAIGVEEFRPTMEHLAEPEAQDLLYEIARFEQSVWCAKEQLEACVLVNYLFSLCNTTSRALKRLNVKHESCASKQRNRILLFSAAKRTLKTGMELLGLRPLNKM